jgi:hypothetical protein
MYSLLSRRAVVCAVKDRKRICNGKPPEDAARNESTTF